MFKFQELKLDGRGGSADSLAHYFTNSTEYYQSKETRILPPGGWYGKLAEQMRLSEEGRESKKDLGFLMAGFDPNNKEKELVQKAGTEKRIKGYDLMFAPPKSFSIAFMRANKQEQELMLKAHMEAVKTALDYIKDNLHTRAGKTGSPEERNVKVEGLAIWQIIHADSREKEIQLHTHNVLANVALDAEGETRAIDGATLSQIAFSAGALYDHTVASNFEKLGFRVMRERAKDPDGRLSQSNGLKCKEDEKPKPIGNVAGHTYHEIQGIDEKLRDAFSTRHKQIVEKEKQEKLDINGKGTGRTYTNEEATLLTRKNKLKSTTPESIIENGNKVFDTLNGKMGFGWITTDDLKNEYYGRETIANEYFTNKKDFAKSIDDMVQEIQVQKTTFTKFDLVEKIAYECDYQENPVLLANQWIESQLQQKELFQIRSNEKREPVAEFITKKQLDLETNQVKQAITRFYEAGFEVDKTTGEKAIYKHEERQGFKLSDEQRKAVDYVLYESGGFAIIRGEAGTGKSAITGAYVEAYKDSGYTCYGVAPSGSATDTLLEETGMECKTISAMSWALEQGKIEFTDKTLLVMDEAGMVGSHDYETIKEHIDQVGGKMVIQGDHKQLDSIESGNPYKGIFDDKNITHTVLKEIRRQKHDTEKGLSKAFSDGNSASEIVEYMKEHDYFTVADRIGGKVKACVADYLADSEGVKDKLIVCQTHKDIQYLTNHLRTQLKEQGTLPSEGVQVKTMGKKGEKSTLEFCVGDRVRFQAPLNKLGIRTNDLGTVKSLGMGKNGKPKLGIVLDKDEDQKTLQVETSEYNRLTHGYASTVHSAQGLGVNSVYWIARGDQTLNRRLAYVAVSRTKERFQCYASEKDISVMSEKLNDQGYKKTALDLDLGKFVDGLKQEKAHERLKAECRVEGFKKVVNKQQEIFLGKCREAQEKFQQATDKRKVGDKQARKEYSVYEGLSEEIKEVEIKISDKEFQIRHRTSERDEYNNSKTFFKRKELHRRDSHISKLKEEMQALETKKSRLEEKQEESKQKAIEIRKTYPTGKEWKEIQMKKSIVEATIDKIKSRSVDSKVLQQLSESNYRGGFKQFQRDYSKVRMTTRARWNERKARIKQQNSPRQVPESMKRLFAKAQYRIKANIEARRKEQEQEQRQSYKSKLKLHGPSMGR